MYWQIGLGYQLNQVLFTNLLILADDLSKYAYLGCLWVFLPLGPFVSKGIIASVITGSSAISNQLEAGLIIIRHIKSATVPSLPLKVYGHIRSTHSTLQGFVLTSLVGSFSYLCFSCLLTWHLWQFLINLWIVVLIPFQYMAAQRVFQVLCV